MAPTNDSGYNTPNSELDLPVHPTSVRHPHAITVQSENTIYTEEHITARFLNRGSHVTVSDGQYTITPTIQPYEFQTKRAVGKTG